MAFDDDETPVSNRRTSENSLRLNSKTITAIGAILISLFGAGELRLKVGTMSDRLDRVERLVERMADEPKDPYARNTP